MKTKQKSYNILLIDDEVQIVELLDEFLTSKGFGVRKATSGEEGLCALISGKAIDLIVLDAKMPGMDGIQVKKEMKRLGLKIPIIVLSGSLGLSHLEAFKEIKGDRILVKPIRLSELLDVVNDILAPK